MPAIRNPMKYLCTEESRIKRLYYGDIYRSTFSVSGTKQAWDILNIRIPFDPDKEAYFMRRFNLDRSELPSFYKSFERAIINHHKVMAALNAAESENVAKSVVQYKSVNTFPIVTNKGRTIGTDYYFIMEPMESFVGSDQMKPSEIRLFEG